MPKRHEEEEHEEHENHEAWVIPYADMLTLLMAMFLMLYAVGTIDSKKFQALAGAFRQEIAGESKVVDPGVAEGMGDGMLDGSLAAVRASAWPVAALVGSLTGKEQRTEGAQALAEQQAQEAAQAAESAQFDQVEQGIRAEVDALGLGDKVQFTRNERGLLITVLSDEVLFAAGGADLNPASWGLLDSLGHILETSTNTIEVVGHTDATPIHTAQFPSNWELSTARAGSVVRYLIDSLALPPSRLRASGLADIAPIDTNDTPEGRARNRRVEITVLSALTPEGMPATAQAGGAAADQVAAAPPEGGTTSDAGAGRAG